MIPDEAVEMNEKRDYTKPAGIISEIFLDGASHEASGLAIANAVLAQIHPVVRTMEEVEALPVGSVLLDAFEASCTKVRTGLRGWRRVTPAVANGEGHWHAPYLPAMVLHSGDSK